MKTNIIAILSLIALLASGCSSSGESKPSGGGGSGGGGSGGGGGGSTDPVKVSVAAHTLKDNNPPIDVGSIGEQVDEDAWNSFRYGSSAKFNGNYNFTYHSYSGGTNLVQSFTKNGYMIESMQTGRTSTLYYERKSGNTFYQYSAVGNEWLREETSLNLQSIYTTRIVDELYVHMFDFENYEYDPSDGKYYYLDYGFGTQVMFQNGYLTHLFYALGTNIFEIKLSFETTISIPKSYYYK